MIWTWSPNSNDSWDVFIVAWGFLVRSGPGSCLLLPGVFQLDSPAPTPPVFKCQQYTDIIINIVGTCLLLPGVFQLDSPPPPHGSNQELRHATYPGSALVE